MIRTVLGSTTVLALTIALAGPASAVAPAPGSTVTTGGDGWVSQAYFCDGDYYTPKQSDVFGPGRAPFGPGSHEMRLGESSQRTELYRTPEYDGTKVADLERLDYSTYSRYLGPDGETSGPARQAPYLRLNVDNDNDGSRDASLFFYPANNGGAEMQQWQNWSTADGQWGVDGDAQPFTTLAAYAAANPDSTIVNNAEAGQPAASGGGLAVIAGCGQGGSNDGQANGIYNIDRVIVGVDGEGTTLHDFGPTAESQGATQNLVVDPTHPRGWAGQAFDADTGADLTSTRTFVKGPGTPPAGVGSVRFAIDDNSDRVEQFRTAAYDGRLLRDLRSLDFATYQRGTGESPTPQQPVYLRLNVDADGDGGMDEQLYYVPANNDAVEQGAWQTWNAVDGKWNIDGDSGPQDAISLATYLAENPDAELVNNGGAGADPALGGAVDFQVGAGGDNQRNGVFYLDDILVELADAGQGRTVTGTSYDLEPTYPGISVSNGSAREANSGTVPLTFTVSLDKAYDDDVVVPFRTEDGTAEAGSDYAAKSGSVTIPAGETSVDVVVDVRSNRAYEPTEKMALVLEQPVYGRLDDATGAGTITDNDTLVTLGLRQATGPRIGADVDTTPNRGGLPVTLQGGKVGTAAKTLLNGELNRGGELHRVLSQSYAKGTRVRVWAKVFTTDGTYRSSTVFITVR